WTETNHPSRRHSADFRYSPDDSLVVPPVNDILESVLAKVVETGRWPPEQPARNDFCCSYRVEPGGVSKDDSAPVNESTSNQDFAAGATLLMTTSGRYL